MVCGRSLKTVSKKENEVIEMNKKQVMASLLVTVSVLGVSPLSALAEEARTTSPVDVVVPAPSETPKVPAEQGDVPKTPEKDKSQSDTVAPDTPVNPSVPSSSDNGKTETPTKPVTPTPDSEKPTQPSETPKPKEEDKKTEPATPKVEEPKETPKTEDLEKPVVPTPEEKKAEENTGVKASDTPKQTNVTEQQIEEQPIMTNTGHTVVGTKEGQVYVQDASGGVELKNASEIGAVKQQDGTVALKDEKGELKVLPKTGTVASLGMSLVGVLMLVTLGVLKKIKFGDK